MSKYDLEAMSAVPELIEQIAAGKTDKFWGRELDIMCMFTWAETPQGRDFWEEESRREVTSPEAQTALDEILAQIKAEGYEV